MEFRFNVNEIFKHQPIVEVNQTMIPPGFSGDRRALWDTVTKVSEIVNAIGEASASAQGLTKPITTSERLRNSEHKLYLLIDPEAQNGKGVISGMLKTGKKSLYVFDREGHHYQVQPPCILDFYVHESRQRSGLGKRLFEHMLKKEDVQPVKLAIDRPSDKFLAFLNKHYTLNNGIKQMNNYVVFDGFFPERRDTRSEPQEHESPSPTKIKQSANGLQTNYSSTYGRYGAPRPPCSMGQIIHNQSSTVTKANEPSGENPHQQSSANRPETPANPVTVNNQSQGPQVLANPVQNVPYYVNQIPHRPQEQQVYAQPQTIFNAQPHANPTGMPFNYQATNPSVQNQQLMSVPNNQMPFVPQVDNNNNQYDQRVQYSNRREPLQIMEGIEQNEVDHSRAPNDNRDDDGMYSPCYPFAYGNAALISPILNRQHDSSQIPRLCEQLQAQSISSRPKLSRTPSAKTNDDASFEQNNVVRMPRATLQVASNPKLPDSERQTSSQPNQYAQFQSIPQQSQLLPPNFNSQQNTTHQQFQANNSQAFSQQIQPNHQQLQTNPQPIQPNLQQFQPNLQQLQPNVQQLQPNVQQLQPNVQQLQPNVQQFRQPQNLQINQQAGQQQMQPSNASQFASVPMMNEQYNLSQLNQSNSPVNQSTSMAQREINAVQSPYNLQNNNQQQNIPNNDNVRYVQEQFRSPPTVDSANPNRYPQFLAATPPHSHMSPEQPRAIANEPINNDPMNYPIHPIQRQNSTPNASGDMQPYPIGPQHQQQADIRNEEQDQHHQVNHENAKLERPNSLSIQQSEEDENVVISTTVENVKSEVKASDDAKDGHDQNDENVVVADDADDFKKHVDDIVSDTSAKLNVSPQRTDETPSKKTPSHLTEQGFFDLKFYHNKLW